MGRLIEGLWDCPYCETEGIKGGRRECPNCGRPRSKGTKFYMPQRITCFTEKMAKDINRNPDWICPYCNSLNSDNDTHCKSCSSERTEANLDYFSEDAEKTTKEQSDFIAEADTKKQRITLKQFFVKKWKLFVIVPIIILFLVGLVYLLTPKNEEITIQKFEWERSIQIERFQTVEKSDWVLPTGARLRYINQEISNYEQVLDHYETRTRQVAQERLVGYEEYVQGYRDLGNGYFEEIIGSKPIYETYYETEYYQEPIYVRKPIYQTKYYYEIDEWLYERSVTAKETDQNPYWAEVILESDERTAEKVECYYIYGTNKKGREIKLKISYENWIELKKGQTVKVKISIFGTGEIIN